MGFFFRDRSSKTDDRVGSKVRNWAFLGEVELLFNSVMANSDGPVMCKK